MNRTMGVKINQSYGVACWQRRRKEENGSVARVRSTGLVFVSFSSSSTSDTRNVESWHEAAFITSYRFLCPSCTDARHARVPRRRGASKRGTVRQFSHSIENSRETKLLLLQTPSEAIFRYRWVKVCSNYLLDLKKKSALYKMYFWCYLYSFRNTGLENQHI